MILEQFFFEEWILRQGIVAGGMRYKVVYRQETGDD